MHAVTDSFPSFRPQNPLFFDNTTPKTGDVIPSGSDCWVCWWDTEPIDPNPNTGYSGRKSLPIHYSVKHRPSADATVETASNSSPKLQPLRKESHFKFIGAFCCWECVAAFDAHHFKRAHNHNIRVARRDIDCVPLSSPLRSSPLPYVLEKYGGSVTLFQYRNWWTGARLPKCNNTKRGGVGADGDDTDRDDDDDDVSGPTGLMPQWSDCFQFVVDSDWKFRASAVRILNPPLIQPTATAPPNANLSRPATAPAQFSMDTTHHNASIYQCRRDELHPRLSTTPTATTSTATTATTIATAPAIVENDVDGGSHIASSNNDVRPLAVSFMPNREARKRMIAAIATDREVINQSHMSSAASHAASANAFVATRRTKRHNTRKL